MTREADQKIRFKWFKELPVHFKIRLFKIPVLDLVFHQVIS